MVVGQMFSALQAVSSRVVFWFCLLASSLWLAGCGADKQQGEQGDKRAEIRQVDGVVASDRSLHSLASMIMAGSGSPYLLVQSTGSPHHHFHLTPEQFSTLNDASVIFYWHRSFEDFLTKPLRTLAQETSAHVVELAGTEGLQLWPLFRFCGAFLHNNCKTERDENPNRVLRHDDKDEPIDPHIWFDVGNALRAAFEVARVLIKLYPENRELYEANAELVKQRLIALDEKLMRDMTPYRDKPFVMQHDAYQYFVKRYALQPLGAVDDALHGSPSTDHILKLRILTRQYFTRCMITAPQFSDRWLKAATSGIPYLQVVNVDHLGAKIPAGPDFYVQLMTQMGEGVASCLSL